MKPAKIACISIMTLSMFFLYMQTCLAAPNEINFQGRLIDIGGSPVPDGNYFMNFAIYDGESSSSALWAEDHNAIPVVDGIYSVTLGTGTIIGGSQDFDAVLFSGAERWLEISVQSETLAPRQKISSTAYALQAQIAERVVDDSIVTAMLKDQAVDQSKLADGAVTSIKIEDGTITNEDMGPNIDADTLGGKTLAEIHVEETDPTVNPDVKDGVSWSEIGSIPQGFSDGTDDDSGGDITSVNTSATSGLIGGTESGDATLQVNFAGGTGVARTVARSDHNHDGDYYSKQYVNDLEDRIEASEERIAELVALLAHLTIVQGELSGMPGPHMIIEGANLHVQSGSGSTDGEVNGLGNLVVGYNESRPNEEWEIRSCSLREYDNYADCIAAGGVYAINHKYGSHNMVVGKFHNFMSYAGVVFGHQNTLSGSSASLTGGYRNEARGVFSSVSGGTFNKATGTSSSVSGGVDNQAVGSRSSITGGKFNTTSGLESSVSGGGWNHAFSYQSAILGGYRNSTGNDFNSNLFPGDPSVGIYASISGGSNNRADGNYSSISGGGSPFNSGGTGNHASANYSTIQGGRENDTGENQYSGDHTIGEFASISGGQNNLATGDFSSICGGSNGNSSGSSASISGGYNNTASGAYSSVSGGGSSNPDYGNHAYANYSSILGGIYNTTGTGDSEFDPNHTTGERATISGGDTNRATGTSSTVSGGVENTASGWRSTISGGSGLSIDTTDGYRSPLGP